MAVWPFSSRISNLMLCMSEEREKFATMIFELEWICDTSTGWSCVCMGQTLSKTMFCTAAVGYFFSIFPQQPVARILNGAAWYHIMCTNVCIVSAHTVRTKKTALSNKSIAFAYIFANHFKLCELLVKVKKKKTKKKKKEKNKKKANHTD